MRETMARAMRASKTNIEIEHMQNKNPLELTNGRFTVGAIDKSHHFLSFVLSFS